MIGCVIERADAGDAGKLAPLFDAYRLFYGLSSDEDSARRFLRDRLARDESVVFFASGKGDAAVGFVQLYPLFSSLAMRRAFVLNDLYVAPAARRAGTARALLSRVERFARESGAQYVTLQTAASNHAARTLYESVGYRRDGAFEQYQLTLEALS